MNKGALQDIQQALNAIMDVLAIGNYVLYKEHQDEALKENYEERYELD